MPSNIFATTGTNVSVLFLDATRAKSEKAILIDASQLGTSIKEGKNQKTVLSPGEEDLVIDTFRNNTEVEEFSISLTGEQIALKDYSFAAGQYLVIKNTHVDLTKEEFDSRINRIKTELVEISKQSKIIDESLLAAISDLRIDEKG
jgi:type I restriction enzyme M protein